MAVTFDNAAALSDSSSGANTLSYTMGSSTGGIIIVGAHTSGLSGITYNGVSLSLLADSTNTNYSYYYLQSPATGANDLVVTRSAPMMNDATGFVMSFTGVQQSGNPFGSVQSGSGTSTTGFSNSVTTSDSGSMIVDFYATLGNPFSVPSPTTATGTGHVLANNTYLGSGDQVGFGGGYTPASTSGSYSVGYSWSTISTAANWFADYYELKTLTAASLSDISSISNITSITF